MRASSFKNRIVTQNFLLDNVRAPDDAPALFALAVNPHFSYPCLRETDILQTASIRKGVDSYLALMAHLRQHQRKTQIRGIFDHKRRDLCGLAALREVKNNSASFNGADPALDCEIGFYVEASGQSHNIATEAMHGLIGWGVENIGLGGLWASVDPHDRATIAVLEKLRMNKDETLRKDRRHATETTVPAQAVYFGLPKL